MRFSFSKSKSAVLRCSCCSLILLPALLAQDTANHAGTLQELNTSLRALTKRIAPSVVQIQTTRLGSVEDNSQSTAGLLVSRQRTIGSGVLVDAAGYILTNAHVVQGSESIRVLIVPHPEDIARNVLSPTRTLMRDAKLVGIYKEGDLALIKVEPGNLPAPLPFADPEKLRQGDLVFACGSPAGLQNSVSMGVVSSIARQPDPDSPVFYIQTDAPINHGNSGGPLVNVDGEVVGINTAILSESGGSEGIGFAIPSSVARFVYQELKEHGHVHRLLIGAGVQAITEPLAQSLDLARDWGVLVSDVVPGGPAEGAGLMINDILLSVEGDTIDTVVAFEAAMFRQAKKPRIRMGVLRGNKELTLEVTPVEEPHPIDRISDLLSSEQNIVLRLGVLAFTVDEETRPMLGKLRVDSGVVVAAKTLRHDFAENGLQTGDVIHTVNGRLIENLDSLRTSLHEIRPHDPVALLIERGGGLEYVVISGD